MNRIFVACIKLDFLSDSNFEQVHIDKVRKAAKSLSTVYHQGHQSLLLVERRVSFALRAANTQ